MKNVFERKTKKYLKNSENNFDNISILKWHLFQLLSKNFWDFCFSENKYMPLEK